MMRLLAVVLWVGVLLLVGCENVEKRSQTVQATVAQSPGPAAESGGLQGQERLLSGATDTEPNGAEIRPARAGGDNAVAVDPAGGGSEAQSENIGRKDGAAAIHVEPVDAHASVSGETHEPGTARSIGSYNVAAPELNSVKLNVTNASASAPIEPNDAATGASEGAASVVFEEYAEILKTYVREDGLVDYVGLRRRRLDLKPLLMKFGELDPNVYQQWPRDEKLAFWINAYNLKMLDIVTRNYPIQSSWWLRLTWPPDDIRHIRGIWTDFRFVVMDEEFTLAEVERRFFHKTFDDPRVYLALTYACQSSPLLRHRPYRRDNLDRQLDEQVKRFLSSPQGLQIDRRSMVVRLSALLKPAWRGKEFVGRYGTDKKFKNQDPETRAVLNFLTSYLPREDAYFLEVENYALEYINFDWRLNDTSKGY